MHVSPPPPSSSSQSCKKGVQYREAKPLPTHLLDHCTVCFEEQLYSQGLSLLSSALTSGTGTSVAAHIPPTQHLALAATLAVHPQLTTRTTSSDKQVAADDAFVYLQHVHSILGPRQSCLTQAFQFSDSATLRRGKRARTRVSEVGSDNDDDDDKPGHIRSAFADRESLWTNAADFWSVVGWAFNCSVVHKHRWQRWKLWLDSMIDILQNDLEAALPEAEKLYQASQSTVAVREILKDSMFAQYLSPIGQGRNNRRRLMRAVLADGSHKSLAEFGEIWRHESKPPNGKQDERVSKRRKLDLDNDEFGDYFDDSDEESPGSSVRRSRSTTAQASRIAFEEQDEGDDDVNGTKTQSSLLSNVEVLGGMESIDLRQRLLALLSLFCSKNPDAFHDTEDLFDLYTEFLKPLPLAVFQQFVLPIKPWLGPNSQASLNQMLLRPLLVANAPAYDENSLTQAEFETYYAGYAANNMSHVDNAKVSLLNESLIRLLWNAGKLQSTSKLRQLVEQGIDARKGKASLDGRRNVGDRMKANEEAVLVLECSAERMLMILDMAG